MLVHCFPTPCAYVVTVQLQAYRGNHGRYIVIQRVFIMSSGIDNYRGGATDLKGGGTNVFDSPLFGQWGDKYCLDIAKSA